MLNAQGSSTSAGSAGGHGGAVGTTTARRTANGVLLRTGTTSSAVAASTGPGADGVCGAGVGLRPVVADRLGAGPLEDGDATVDRATRAGTARDADDGAETEACAMDAPGTEVDTPGAGGAGAALPGTGPDRSGCTA